MRQRQAPDGGGSTERKKTTSAAAGENKIGFVELPGFIFFLQALATAPAHKSHFVHIAN